MLLLKVHGKFDLYVGVYLLSGVDGHVPHQTITSCEHRIAFDALQSVFTFVQWNVFLKNFFVGIQASTDGTSIAIVYSVRFFDVILQ